MTLGRGALVLALAGAALYPSVDRLRGRPVPPSHLHDLPDDLGALTRVERLGGVLASWQTVGGCGAGASSGTGAGVKWVGRNVSGGLFHVECQANYIKTTYGYNYVGTTLVTRDLDEKWNLGASVPYLYKYMNNPYGQGFDVANRGIGDAMPGAGHPVPGDPNAVSGEGHAVPRFADQVSAGADALPGSPNQVPAVADAMPGGGNAVSGGGDQVPAE